LSVPAVTSTLNSKMPTHGTSIAAATIGT